MKTIDNFLSKKDFDSLKKIITTTTFPWYYNDSKSAEGDDNFQFVHIFFWDNKILSPFWNHIAPILDKLKAKKIIRIKANLTTKKANNIKSKMHIDTNVEKSITSVFYVNTNNGSTLFEDGNICKSKENRIITFKSKTKHCGVDTTDTDIRIVINFNYLQ